MLIQICPPGPGGVRDYADCLRAAWAATGLASTLVEAEREPHGQAGLAAQLGALFRAGPGAPAGDRLVLVVQFSGYGYARRGLCQWLVDELQSLKAALGERMRLVVVFHELFATGAPWRSAFWLAPLQSLIARQLAAMADSLWTNTARHARWLRSVAGPAKPISVRPVFSNVGEPAVLPRWSEREKAIVVFGSAATRSRALKGLGGHEATLRGLGVTEVIEVGTGASCGLAPGPLPLRHLGRLSTQDLNAVLANTAFGLLDYPASYLGKSGVFAAYAAHGCVAVNTSLPEADTDGLRAGVHYLPLAAAAASPRLDAPEMARCLSHWYRTHSLRQQALELLAAVHGTPLAA